MKDALRKLTALGRDIENKAGLYLVANIAGRVGNVMQVKQYVFPYHGFKRHLNIFYRAGSPLGLAFLDGPAGQKSGALLGDWLLEHEGE
jgi:hypothetical protein